MINDGAWCCRLGVRCPALRRRLAVPAPDAWLSNRTRGGISTVGADCAPSSALSEAGLAGAEAAGRGAASGPWCPPAAGNAPAGLDFSAPTRGAAPEGGTMLAGSTAASLALACSCRFPNGGCTCLLRTARRRSSSWRACRRVRMRRRTSKTTVEVQSGARVRGKLGEECPALSGWMQGVTYRSVQMPCRALQCGGWTTTTAAAGRVRGSAGTGTAQNSQRRPPGTPC